MRIGEIKGRLEGRERDLLAFGENPEKLSKETREKRKKKGRGERAKPKPKQHHFD